MFIRQLSLTRLPSSLSHLRTYSTATGPNKAVIDLLTKCLKEENSSPTRNAYKVRSFQVAIAAILEHDKPIKSGQEAIKLRGIGLGIANRIDFFLQGKEYDEGLEHQAKQRLLAIETFEKIPGIGQRTATNLVNEGAVSVSDLNLPKYAALLKPTQKVGVLYGEHITKPISRAEAEEIASFIRDHISCNFEVHLTGAYRRESTELPEVTILLHHHLQIHVPTPSPPSPSTTATTTKVHARVRTRGKQHVPFLQVNTSAAQRRASPLLQDVIRPLEAAGLLAAPLAPAGPRKWRGVALLPLRAHSNKDANTNAHSQHELSGLDGYGGAWQEVGDRMRDLRAGRGKYIRLNLSLAPLKSRGAAQIILTGDEEFVRIARLAAARLGMHLDEYGLWRWHTSEEAALESQTSTSTPTPTSSPSSPSTSSLSSGSGFGLPSSSSTTDTTAPTGYWERRNFRFLTSKKRASARAGTFDFSLAILTGKETEDDFFPKVGRPSPMREGESGADG